MEGVDFIYRMISCYPQATKYKKLLKNVILFILLMLLFQMLESFLRTKMSFVKLKASIAEIIISVFTRKKKVVGLLKHHKLLDLKKRARL